MDTIDFDALFPGLNKDKKPILTYRPLLEMYRATRSVLKQDGATDEEARDLTLLLIKPGVEHAVYTALEKGD